MAANQGSALSEYDREKRRPSTVAILTPAPFCWQLCGCRRNIAEDTMKFSVTIDRDEDGVWVVECPSIPSCVSQGQTKDEALENIKEAIALCLEVRAEKPDSFGQPHAR